MTRSSRSWRSPDFQVRDSCSRVGADDRTHPARRYSAIACASSGAATPASLPATRRQRPRRPSRRTRRGTTPGFCADARHDDRAPARRSRDADLRDVRGRRRGLDGDKQVRSGAVDPRMASSSQDDDACGSPCVGARARRRSSSTAENLVGAPALPGRFQTIHRRRDPASRGAGRARNAARAALRCAHACALVAVLARRCRSSRRSYPSAAGSTAVYLRPAIDGGVRSPFGGPADALVTMVSSRLPVRPFCSRVEPTVTCSSMSSTVRFRVVQQLARRSTRTPARLPSSRWKRSRSRAATGAWRMHATRSSSTCW